MRLDFLVDKRMVSSLLGMLPGLNLILSSSSSTIEARLTINLENGIPPQMVTFGCRAKYVKERTD